VFGFENVSGNELQNIPSLGLQLSTQIVIAVDNDTAVTTNSVYLSLALVSYQIKKSDFVYARLVGLLVQILYHYLHLYLKKQLCIVAGLFCCLHRAIFLTVATDKKAAALF